MKLCELGTFCAYLFGHHIPRAMDMHAVHVHSHLLKRAAKLSDKFGVQAAENHFEKQGV